jgi:predicted transcriptional regulator
MEKTNYKITEMRFDVLRYLERNNNKSITEIVKHIKEISNSNRVAQMARSEIPYLVSSGFASTNRATGEYKVTYSITNFGKELLQKKRGFCETTNN